MIRSLVWRAHMLVVVVAALVLVSVSQQSHAAESKPDTKVDLNKATEAQLLEVPGIGEAYAKKVIAGRPYKTVDDLSKAGIPTATISKIRSRVSVAADKTPAKSSKSTVPDTQSKTVDLNKASEAQLESVPGIGPTYSKKIIAGRPYKTVDDLSKVGIPTATISTIRSHVTVVADKTPAKDAKDTKKESKETKEAKVAKPATTDTKSATDAKSATVNLNKATQAQLEDVPGIGEAYAKKIIAGRPYKSVDDLSKAGIPATTITKIKSLVTVAEPAAVAHTVTKPVTSDTKSSLPDLNKATEAQLQEVPGIGEAYAKKIVAGRPYKSVDDLSKAGIPDSTVTKIKSLVTVNGSTTFTPPPVKGMVWVNLESKKYHKDGSQWYGKTKSGKYMNEADAIKAGYTAAKQQ